MLYIQVNCNYIACIMNSPRVTFVGASLSSQLGIKVLLATVIMDVCTVTQDLIAMQVATKRVRKSVCMYIIIINIRAH